MSNNNNIEFAKGVYVTNTATKYGNLINLKIDVNLLKRNRTTEDTHGSECVFITLKTNRDGVMYAVINDFQYNNKPQNQRVADEECPF